MRQNGGLMTQGDETKQKQHFIPALRELTVVP